MTVKIRSRYGYTSTPTPDTYREAFAGLLQELRTERYEEPDNEHTRVGIEHGDVYIEIQVDGMVTLGDFRALFKKTRRDAITAKDVYLADVPDERMLEILMALAAGDHQTVLAAGWGPKSDLPPHTADFYRLR